MHRSKRAVRQWLVCLLAGLLVSAVAFAHVDTLAQVINPDPLTRAFEAESLPTLGAARVVADPHASGGKAVLLSGRGAGFKVDFGRLPVGMHVAFLCAKVVRDDAWVKSVARKGALVGGGGVQLKPRYFHLKINSGVRGKVETYRLRVPFDRQYEYMVKIYFHTPEARDYKGEIFIGPRSLVPEVYVDRVEVRNPLAGLEFRAVKTKSVLFTGEERRQLLMSAAKEGKVPRPLRPRELGDAERLRRDEILWNNVMPMNANPAQIYGGIFRGNALLTQITAQQKAKLGRDLGKWEVASTRCDEPWKRVNKALGLEYTLDDYNAGRTLPKPWPFPEDKGGYFFDAKQWGVDASFNYGIVPMFMQSRYHNLSRYVRAGGARRFNLADPRQYPRLAAMADGLLRLHVAGGHRPGTGDVNDPQNWPRCAIDPKKDAEFLLASWRWTGDPRLAWVLANQTGQGTVGDREWAKIAAASKGARNPFIHTESNVLEGYGSAHLEEGVDATDRRYKNAVMLRFGVPSGHAHADTLDLEVYAHGCRMTSDVGGRSSGKYGHPNCMKTFVHNLVDVDEKSFNSGTAQNATGIGWLNAFKPNAGAQFVEGSARAEALPNVLLYRRGVLQVMCDPGDGKSRTPSGYVFDVFRVAGGKVHTWCFYGCVSEALDCNAGLKPATSELATRYLSGHLKGTQQEGVAPALLEATWTMRRKAETADGIPLKNAEQTMLHELWDTKAPRKFTRVSLFGHAGDKVMVANTACSVTLPGGKASLSPDGGRTWRALPGQKAPGKVTVALREADLGAGTVQLKVGR